MNRRGVEDPLHFCYNEREGEGAKGGTALKKLGIGYEDYKEFIDRDMYYVDKTMLIREVREEGGKVTLFTRPRRFGKTLALSMLRTFFELEYGRDGNAVDKSRYFEGKRIMEEGGDILSEMGKYPVIKLSLKSAKQPDFYSAFLKLREDIIGEFLRHDYVLMSDGIKQSDKDVFQMLLSGRQRWYKLTDRGLDGIAWEKEFRNEVERYSTSLKLLSEALQAYHGRKVVILLDEYDVPLENAYFNGFSNEMVGFIRSLFESALKTNDALEFAVVTGCLRISRESIFTGLNHLEINSVRGKNFSEAFGFTQQETERMLADYGLYDKLEEVQRWYDGYLFGEKEIYNPWSLIKYVSDHVASHNALPEAYWANTSSNSIIRDLVYNADENQKRELEYLIDGGTIEKQIHEDITYDDIHESEDNLWNFLFFTGYMKKVSEWSDGRKIFLKMCIPNLEIENIYTDQISSWFDRIKKKADRSELYKAILERDGQKMGDFLTDLLEKSISTFDSKEDFYHGFFLSLLYGLARYEPRSNREHGIGRPDIVLYPMRPADPAYLFEIKVRKKFNEMEGGIQEAFAQIEDQNYEEGILEDGYAGVISYGVCFCKKSAIVRMK